jgi:hypothetical protein
VQSKQNPERTQIDNQVVVDLQSFNSCASGGSQTEDARTVGAPLKMIRPFLPARVKELGVPSGCRIARRCDLPLMTVAGSATQTEISDHGFAATRCRSDVIGLEWNPQ